MKEPNLPVIAVQGIKFTSFLVKVASRCNIKCDYCYMYEHKDQGWRDQPHVMSAETRRRVAGRLGEYATAAGLDRMLVIFHGGEPLLAGASTLAAFAEDVRSRLPKSTEVDFSVQTNGVLLDDHAVRMLSSAEIAVSLSLDGPQHANDRHRLAASGGSTFPAVVEAMRRLEQRPDIFAGIIAVIDPAVAPEDVLGYFATRSLPAVDLLLPDANHKRPPEGRGAEPDRYRDWLIEAFDLWYDRYPHLAVRTFDALLAAVAGLPSGTDAFGFGDVSLLTIETDGSYHDLDVLKITQAGQTALGADVIGMSITDVADSPKLAAHRRLLTRDGLSHTCRVCPVVDVCGGGSVPHRYADNGFDNPTVYCAEMLALIQHVERRMASTVSKQRDGRAARGAADRVDVDAFEQAATAVAAVDRLMSDWRRTASTDIRALVAHHLALGGSTKEARTALQVLADADDNRLARVAIRPSVVLWTRVGNDERSGTTLRRLDGTPVPFDPAYATTVAQMMDEPSDAPVPVHRDDPWLRVPFSEPIVFADETEAAPGRRLVAEAITLITDYDPTLAAEIKLISPEIQFVRDTSAHPDKVVSFSDDVVPGALYLGLGSRTGGVDVYDLADSMIHEHRHQKLYLLSREVELVVVDRPLIASPWREEPRPPSGLLHAAWVFVELLRFWHFVEQHADPAVRTRAASQIATTQKRLTQAWQTLATCQLTPAGRHLTAVLEQRSRT
ncbi:cyclophane-forming radical SAM/SPASM peptide maturase YhhB [Micromonospora sp. HUAS LYJ1]|uniref:cyclophane-forming radical SAM/SPASM peptide maturase YhhB n=1 Tax=Micromonospora sp. HUAS LYJ1 TaxID=3061626 RepID=UPI002673DAF5|nr:cyclophane-forming radical SAM/SPASM peptide maturase YhhB [Micromonospora sp. HUAS LYJ1]WKU04461.1 cyclophane-forming radical SAM/SPASM peptide maturase YhhB [Micromonospora sp. HUAS LYJ1]